MKEYDEMIKSALAEDEEEEQPLEPVVNHGGYPYFLGTYLSTMK